MNHRYKNKVIRINTRDHNIIFYLFGIIFGFVFFILVYGVEIVNPFNYEWNVANGGDSALTFLGGLFFQKTDLCSSNMGIDSLTYPHNCSLIFYDGIIPLAYLFRLLYQLFFDNHTVMQYVGLHNFLCCGIQGFFAALISVKLTDYKILRVLGTILLTDTSILMWRLISHNSLGAQYIILAAISIYLYKEKLKDKRYLLWVSLVSYSAIMHLYFTLMLAFLYAFDIGEEIAASKKWIKNVALYGCTFLIAAFVLWFFGGFQTEVACAPYGSDKALFQYHSNLLTLLDPNSNSLFVPDLPEGVLQYEGYGYLGIGVIVLLLSEVFFLVHFYRDKLKFRRKIRKEKVIPSVTVFLTIAISFLVAVGPHIMFGDHLLVDIRLPDFTYPFFLTFKSLGRFIWITVYALICVSIYWANKIIGTGKISKRICMLFLVAVCTIQVVELFPFYKERHEKFAHYVNWQSVMLDEKWNELAEEKEYVYVITDELTNQYDDLSNSMRMYVYFNDLKLTSTLIAHPSELLHEEALSYISDIRNGIVDAKAIYWFESEEYMNEAGNYMHTEILDGFYVGWTE